MTKINGFLLATAAVNAGLSFRRRSWRNQKMQGLMEFLSKNSTYFKERIVTDEAVRVAKNVVDQQTRCANDTTRCSVGKKYLR